MIITLIAAILALFSGGKANGVVTIPPMPTTQPETQEDVIWIESYDKAESEFDALFASYETKRARNGAMMIRSGNSGSFKFAKKG